MLARILHFSRVAGGVRIQGKNLESAVHLHQSKLGIKTHRDDSGAATIMSGLSISHGNFTGLYRNRCTQVLGVQAVKPVAESHSSRRTGSITRSWSRR